MAKDVLAAVGPLASQLIEQLTLIRTLRVQNQHAKATIAEALAGALMVKGPLASWMVSKFRRMGASAEQAEDLAQDVWFKLIKMAADGKLVLNGRAIGLLGQMANTRWADHYNATTGTELDPRLREEGHRDDGESGDGLDTGVIPEPTLQHPDLADCVQRKTRVFAIASPGRARLLELDAFGHTRREIASIVFQKPLDRVTALDEGAIRDRLYEARKQAKPYFKDCED